MANNLYQVTSSLCIVYKRPSYFGGILALISKGTIIEVISISNGWAYFKYNNRDAYTCTYNLTIVVPETSVAGSITINYLDESTNVAIATASVVSDLKLGSYSYDAIEIKGYSLISNASQSITLTEESPDQIINFIYKKILGSVTIKYINQSSKTELLPSESYSNLELGVYSYNAKSIDGFSIVSQSIISVELTDSNPNQTITFEYNEILGSIIVKYLEKDTSAEVLSSETFSNLKLGIYTYTAKTLDNYNVSGQTSQTITLTSTSPNQTVTFSYSKVLGSVTIKYVDATSLAEIATSKVITGLSLGTYSYNSIAVSSYTVTGDSTQSVTLTKTVPNATITFKYNKNLGSVTIKYLDNTSKLAIADTVSYTNLEYGTYSYTSKVISGYNIVGDSSHSVTLSDSNQNPIIIFYYDAILGSVTVKYVDKDTQADILTAETYTNLPLGSYSYNSKTVDYYTLSDDSVKTVTLTSTMLNITVTFKYSKILGSVTINYVDSTTGVALYPSSTISNLALGSYSYNAITIDNYSLVGDATQSVTLTSNNANQSVTFKYSKVEIEIPTDLNINEVPYISTYYIKPIVEPGEEVFIDYYITDYYHKEYLEEDYSETFTVTIRVEGQEDKLYCNLKAGDHQINLGSFSAEGEQNFSILCTDKYSRNSHELFNSFLVQGDFEIKEYAMTEEDLKTYNIKNDDNYEIKVYVKVDKLIDVTTGTNIETVANTTIVPSKKYICFIGTDEVDTNGNPIMKTKPARLWLNTIVKYANDYDKAFVLQEATNTRIGLQKLLDDKKTEGYNKLTLLSGNYRIDHQKQIYIPSNFTFDMNDSIIKLNQFTGSSSILLELNTTFNSHVLNGVIDGDYFSHDYTNSSNNSEWANAINICGESKYSSFENFTLQNITGYGSTNGIATSRSGDSYIYFSPTALGNTFKLGDIDRVTGISIDSNKRSTSDFKDISSYLSIGYLSISIYLGYQGNSCSTWNIICHFYDENKNYIKSIDSYQYRIIGIPSNSKYIKITILSTDCPSNLSIHLFKLPTNCYFKNINHINCRCVGMAQSHMKNMLVENCNFTLCGQSGAFCAYDAEDGWDGMQDCTFRNLNFYNNYRNDFLTCAGHNFIIENMINGKIKIWERTNSYLIRNCENISSADLGSSTRVKTGYTRCYNSNFGSISMGSTKDWPKAIKNCKTSQRADGNIYLTYYNCNLGPETTPPKDYIYGLGSAKYKHCTIKNLFSGHHYPGEFYYCTFYNITGSIQNVGSLLFENCNLNAVNLYVSDLDKTLLFKNCTMNQFTLQKEYWTKNFNLEINNCIISNSDYLLKLPHYCLQIPFNLIGNQFTSTGSNGMILFYDDRGTTHTQDTITLKDNNFILTNSKYVINGLYMSTVNNINITSINNSYSPNTLLLYNPEAKENSNINIIEK